MLETIIKNTILVSLIILILHFLIKNKLLENSIKQTRARHVLLGKATPTASILVGGGPVAQTHASPASAGKKDEDADIEAYFKAHVRQLPNAVSKPNPLFNSDEDAVRSKNKQVSDLYNFVYADDGGNSLNAYFDESPSKRTQVKCDPFSNTDKRMCKNPIEMHIESQAKKPLPKKPSDLKYYKNSVEVREYENENVMNGAPLAGNLSGFDTYEVQFQSWN
jgi:hypothetical protein